jgi:hypothetical protein
MSYTRVIPRDLFNESALLKCLGKLALFELDNVVEGLKVVYEPHGDGSGGIVEGFLIKQHYDGDLYCDNVTIINNSGVSSWVFRSYNSREPWSCTVCPFDDDPFEAIDEDGNPTQELIAWANPITYPDKYLHVSHEESGETWIMPIADDDPLSLEKLIDKFLLQQFGGELERDGEIDDYVKLGDYYARIIMDGRPPEDKISWQSCGFNTKTYE